MSNLADWAEAAAIMVLALMFLITLFHLELRLDRLEHLLRSKSTGTNSELEATEPDRRPR